MGQRNMMCTSQMIDSEVNQLALSHLCPEPCDHFGTVANFPQPNVHMMLPAAGNMAHFDIHHLPDSHENALFNRMMQYNGFQHQHPAGNLDLGIPTASNYYNPYMTPSGSRVFPPPVNQGSHDQLPSSSNGGIVGIPIDEYRRNNHFMDGVRSPFKRKNAEGIAGSFQYCNASPGSSSAIAPLNTRPIEPGVTLIDVASFPLAEYRVNDTSPMMEVGSHRSNRLGAIAPDSVLAHNRNRLIQANYPRQAFQTASSPWLNQQFSSNGGNGGTLTWSQAPAVTYLHGSSVGGGCREGGNMNAQGYQEIASNRISTTSLHLPPARQGHPNFHHLPQPTQGVRVHNINFHPQGAMPSRRLSTNSTSHTSMNSFQDGLEVGPRYVGPVPPTGLRILRHHQRALMPEEPMRRHDLPHLRILPADEVAMLEISGYYQVGNSSDHHGDMRLDVDHMSYEELLALGERIGNVATGLSEETITNHLKTRTYISSTTRMNLEEAACVDQETDFCVICQTYYKNQENIGTLDCGHEYHVDCVKRWLFIKNTCPICKSSALASERKDLWREG